MRGSKGSLRSRLGTARDTPRLARFSVSLRSEHVCDVGLQLSANLFHCPPNQSRPSENQSPNYGSTLESPHPHPSTDLRTDELHLASNPDQCKDRSHTPNPKKGVAFSPTAEEIGGQRIDELPETSTRSQSSEDGKSSDGVVQSDSREPLKRRPADLIVNTDKTAPSPRLLGRSGKGFLTPRLSSIRGDATPTSRGNKSPARSPARSLSKYYNHLETVSLISSRVYDAPFTCSRYSYYRNFCSSH